MEKLIFKTFIFFTVFVLIFEAKSAELKAEVKKIWTLPWDHKINKKKVGGLSGCAFHDNQFYFVSDDRGQEGGPRFYKVPFDAAATELNFKSAEIIFVTLEKGEKVLDLEGISLASPDRILLSSEGDLNQKPRLMPSIFWVNAKGQRQQTISFPEEYLAERTGRQTKGLQNNLAFEGLVVDLEYQKWAAMTEAPLMQGPKELKLVESALDSLKFDQIYSYPLPKPLFSDALEQPMTAYFGVTDMLYLTKDSFLVLERGVSLSAGGIGFRTQLCEAVKQNTLSLSRKCFYSMNEDSKITAVVPNGANFEGLCWVDKKKKVFLTVNDNNFSKNEKTVFVLYQLN